MAVVADFTANKLVDLIPPSEIIIFTDISTGSPDSWFWDFGDGTFSNLQNPTHTYTGEMGSSFAVKLIAWIADTPVNISGSASNSSRQNTPVGTNAAAWAAWLAKSWSGGSQPYAMLFLERFIGPPETSAHQYSASRNSRSYTIPSFASTSVIISLEAENVSSWGPYGINVPEGNVTVEINSQPFATVPASAVTGFSPIADLTSFAGTVASYFAYPSEEQLTTPATNLIQHGIIVDCRVMHYIATSPGNKDDESKIVSFIPHEDVSIDFVGTPLSGTSSLAVQFTDLSLVEHTFSVWDFGDGNSISFAGETHPTNTYTSDNCSLGLL